MHSGAGLILEFSSIVRGYYVLDQCLKSAKVHVIEASSISPGKFMIFLKGSVEAVGKAYDQALSGRKSDLIDSALLPNLHKGVLEALYGLSKVEATKSGMAVVETSTLTGMLLGLHNIATTKSAIQYIEVKSGRGMGGKSIAFFTGKTDDLKEAIEIFSRTTKQRGSFVDGQIISSPHPDFLSYFNISGAN